MEVSEYFTINLRLGRRLPFSITIKRSDEGMYRAAEKLINERFGHYASRYPNQDDETYLCMASLDIALSLKNNEARNDTQPFVESMERMLKTLEEALGTNVQ